MRPVRPIGRGIQPRRRLAPMRPPSLFETSKRECAAPGGREKMFRRVGPHTCGPPAAGGERLAIPRGGQGRKRATLGETFGPGKPRTPSALTSAAADCPLRVKEAQRSFDFLPRFFRRTGHAGRGQGKHTARRESAEGRQSLPAPARETPRPRGGPLHRSAGKAFFLFGPCNRAAVGGFAALRMRHTPCGYGPFSFPQDGKENGGGGMDRLSS